VFETVQLDLVPGQDPDPAHPVAPRPYHRLRLLFGLDGAVTGSTDDSAIVAERADIERLPGGDQPTAYLGAFRRYAALDAADLRPLTEVDTGQALLFPTRDDAPVLVANVTGITLKKSAGGGWSLTAATVNLGTRRTLVDTATIQELLCGPSMVFPGPGPALPAGPRALPDTVTWSGNTISFSVTAPLRPSSVNTSAFAVKVLGPAGWRQIALDKADLDMETKKTVTLTLREIPAGDLLSLTVRDGTGGLIGDDSSSSLFGGGTDFVHMIALSGGS
jgi:hypothetical protein